MADDHRLGSVARRLAATQRVLVVEDEHDIADFLFAYFRASGYDLVHVDPDTPLAVLDALDEHEPDCVLLDLNLRGFNGSEAYRLVRTDDRYSLTPIVVVSARPDADQLVPTKVGGLDAVVGKPFNVNSLAEMVVERIAHARELAERLDHSSATGLLGHDYVEARLADELTVAAPGRPASFALVRLMTREEMVVEVGLEGAEYVMRDLVRRAKELLPDDAALGVTNNEELAILLPGTKPDEAVRVLRFAADSLDRALLPGGAEVAVRFAAGVAGYPEHAAEPDGVYMAADAALADAIDSRQTICVAL